MPSVFRYPDGTYRMYYQRWPTNTMFYAHSSDGLDWAVGGQVPFFNSNGSPVTCYGTACPRVHPHVLQIGENLYRMYIETGPTGPIISATSSDGINWTLDPGTRRSRGVVLTLTGNLKAEFGGTPIVGHDVAWIVDKGHP